MTPTDHVVQFRNSVSIEDYYYFDTEVFNVTVKAHNAIKPKKWPKFLDTDLASLLGYMVSEGCGNSFGNESQFIIDDFTSKFKRCFGVPISSNVSYGACVPTVVAKFFKNIGLKTISHLQEIPDCVLNSPDGVISAFLQSAYEGDGWITDRCLYIWYKISDFGRTIAAAFII